MIPHASRLVSFGIPALAVLMLTLIAVAVGRALGKRYGLWFGLGAAAWLGLTAALASSGVLADFDAFPPRLMLVLVPSLGLPLLLGQSRAGAALAKAPIAILVGWQAFRLPLELIMHRAMTEGVMPPQMTYTGRNFDIVTGASAIVVAALAARGLAPRWLLWAWNALGSGLLVAVLAIALSSLPTFAAFGSEPGRLNTWVAYFPYVWLPAGLVSSAVLGHWLLWRRLLARGIGGRVF